LLDVPPVADQFGHLPRGPRRIFQAARWSWQGLARRLAAESSFRLEVYLLILLTRSRSGWARPRSNARC
jgi:diacylglycerol kinase (ATP)